MLYFISTPIGNLKDISYRAVETLKEVDVILCEDTRHSLKLLDFYGIKKQLISYHKYNEKERIAEILSLLQENKNVAVISDAGTPVISDPGNVLTVALRENGVNYTVIPGATAFVPALILSGLDASNFTFVGFLPEKNKDKDQVIKNVEKHKETLIFYSAPHDVKNDISYLYQKLGDRKVAVVKEITKIHETAYLGTLSTVDIVEPKGEFVIIVEGFKGETESGFILSEKEHIDLYISRGYSKKEAINLVAKERGVSKNALYKYTIEE
ncbi:MAG: 16S rRNA (cytidine(1402)-2'-O)-methyltransferase [Clostridiales bacterium]|nr:16S rRNA (cytidine(1402)-2'-O)-methyltransferase [Clostridiales bacterium]